MEVNVIICECEIYMLIEEGKYRILNLVGRIFIVDIDWNKINFEGRIKFRVDLYVKKFLLFNVVVSR